MGYVDLGMLSRWLALVEALSGPECVSLMGHARRCREIGFAPLLVHRHARRDLVQLLELESPEELVEVEIPVVALGGTGISAEEKQLGTVGQDDRVTGQLDTDHLAGERLDISPKQVGLVLRRGQENLIAPGLQRIEKRLPGKVVGGADLPTLEDNAGPLIAGPVPVLLIIKTAIDKRLAQQLDLLFADVVFRSFSSGLRCVWPD
jgi:hypothetical protein